MNDIVLFDQVSPDDVAAVGGKGLSLGRLARAGFPVPAGFCVTTTAFRRHRGQPLTPHDPLGKQIVAAYQQLGGGRVAVRSSATTEDSSTASFAGQQETILGVSGAEPLCAAVVSCWASLDSARAVAYRRQQGIRDEDLAMAVVVQRLVPAEVAGVLFTRDPLDPGGQRMLVEASWGLGESVVSGRVLPDRYHLDRETGATIEQHVARKAVQVTEEGPATVPAEKQDQPCLDAGRLARLVELGRRVEAFYGEPRDIEWAWAGGSFHLLQARPITTADAAEREQARREEISALAARAAPEGTVWSRFNLAEVLPEPTPMTWALVRRLMSGQGGFGLMYRDLGFDPDPALDEEGIFDLVCGRPYCNLSREPRLHFRQVPFEHPFAALKASPVRAIYPQPVINPSRFGWKFWLLLPVALPRLMWRMVRAQLRQQALKKSVPQLLRAEVFPTFERAAGEALKQDLGGTPSRELLDLLERWARRTLHELARDSLKPTALAGLTMSALEQQLARVLGAERAQQVMRDLIMGVRPEADADLPGALQALAAGGLTREDFLAHFGHRGSQEMELSRPRWAEDPEAVDRLIASARGPLARPEGQPLTWEEAAAEARLDAGRREALRQEVDILHTLLGLRESAKHQLMRGFFVLRRILLELDRRYGLNGGIFFLTPEELPRLVGGEDLGAVVAARRRRRAILLGLEVPPVLFSDDLEAIGRPIVPEGAESLQGVPLSAGVADGAALVLTEPAADIPAEPYVLVCPSTDPAWVPLFIHARGLVMETGGVLSHGAIVARELGLPAVAGLPGIVRRLHTGQRVRVDGGRGVVMVLGE